MKKAEKLFALVVGFMLIVGFVELASTPAEAISYPECSTWCPGNGGWCQGATQTPCWQTCNGVRSLLNCDNICGAAC